MDRLTLTVATGEIFGLVGPDGAGKTTVMRLLTGILDPTDGDGWVLGRSIRTDAGGIQEEIGYMSQRFGLYPDLSVSENIHFYADLYGVLRRVRREKVEELLRFSNLAPFRHRLAGNLSGGMKQKLGLACALVHTPKLLFLDEPTNGVDPVSRRDFWRILYGLLRERVTIFVSTAYLDEAERFQRLALLHKGRFLALGSPEELKGLYAGTILEVRCGSPRRAAEIVRREMPDEEARLFGERLHVGTREPDRALRVLGKALSEGGIPYSSIRPIEPALEDVFVALLSGGGPGS